MSREGYDLLERRMMEEKLKKKKGKKHHLQMMSYLLDPLLVAMRNGRWLGLSLEGI